MDQKELVKSLILVLANSFSLYYKASAYHWNVEGPTFPQLHKLFGKIYEEIYDSIDLTAEKIRYNKGYPPYDLIHLLSIADIRMDRKPTSAEEMVKMLEEDNNLIQNCLTSAFKNAEQLNDQGLMDYLAGRMDAHKKHAWMLRATSKF